MIDPLDNELIPLQRYINAGRHALSDHSFDVESIIGSLARITRIILLYA